MLPYMVTWIPSIYPLYVSIYTSTMDPMGYETCPVSQSTHVNIRVNVVASERLSMANSAIFLWVIQKGQFEASGSVG